MNKIFLTLSVIFSFHLCASEKNVDRLKQEYNQKLKGIVDDAKKLHPNSYSLQAIYIDTELEGLQRLEKIKFYMNLPN